MTDYLSDSTLESALVCIDDFYARMFRNWPGAITRHERGYTLSYSGNVYLSGANHVWLHEANAFTARALDEAAAFFAAFEAAWSVVCIQPDMEATIQRLYNQAFTLRWDSALMVLDDEPPANPPGTNWHAPYRRSAAASRDSCQTSARLIRATSQHHLRDLTRVLSESFATGPSVNRRVARIDHLTDPTIRHYILYHGVHPVSAATVMIHPQGMASLWNVGTRPRFRHKGYATTIMTGLLADLRAHGVTTSILLASPSGYPLYVRLGYREIGTVAYLGPPQNGVGVK